MRDSLRMVYVATPYAAINCHDSQRQVFAKRIATQESKKVANAGYIPISPVLCFSEILDEQTQRDKLIEAGLELLSHCSYAYFSKHEDAPKSEGMKKEKELCQQLGITELTFELC